MIRFILGLILVMSFAESEQLTVANFLVCSVGLLLVVTGGMAQAQRDSNTKIA
jgi:hypothetical protein